MYVNIQRLRGKMVECGFTQERAAKEIGMDKSTLSRKINGGGKDFTIGEVHKIADILSLSQSEAQGIFLA